MTHVNPILNQTDFRFRVNSGNEATATWLAAINTNISIDVDTSFRYRVVVAETAGSTNPETVNLLLFFSLNSGSFTLITGSTPIQFASFTGSSDGDVTTQQLGSGTFVDGELDNTGVVSNLDLQSSETEMEYCLTIDSGQVDDTDTIDLRAFNSSVALDNYGNTGRATVIEDTTITASGTPSSELAVGDGSGEVSISGSGTPSSELSVVSGDSVVSINASGAVTSQSATSGGGEALFKITSNTSSIPSTLSNFIGLAIGGNFPAAFWAIVKSDGGDVRVYLDQAKTQQIAHDVVTIDVGAEEIELRYDIASLSGTVAKDIYIEAGDSAKNTLPVTDTFGRNNTWLEARTALCMESATPVDRTGNHTFGVTGTLTNIDGPFGKANSFVSTDRLSNTDAALVDILETYDTTLSVISRRTAYVTVKAVMSWEGTDDFVLYPMDTSSLDGVRVFWRDLGGTILDGPEETLENTFIWNDFTTRASDDHEVYTNGVSGDTSSATGTAGPFSSFDIGGFGTQHFDGDVAQVIVWKTARSSDYTAAKRNNESDAVDFWGVAVQVEFGVSSAIVSSFGIGVAVSNLAIGDGTGTASGPITASGSPSSELAVGDGDGIVSIDAIGITLSELSVGDGDGITSVIGSGTPSSELAIGNGDGITSVVGNGTAESQLAIGDGEGVADTATTAEGSPSSELAIVNAFAITSIDAIGVATSESPIVDSQGITSIFAVGVALSDSSIVNSSGLVTVSAIGIVQSEAATGDGQGITSITAQGSAISNISLANGLGEVFAFTTAVGSATSLLATVSGFGNVFEPSLGFIATETALQPTFGIEITLRPTIITEIDLSPTIGTKIKVN